MLILAVELKTAVRTVRVRRTFRTERTAIFHFAHHFRKEDFAKTSMPIKPRTRLPFTWMLLVASTL